MRNDLPNGRRLRFAVQMGDRESIPGAIARGVRQHVLVRTAPVLEAAGVNLRHAGLTQIASPEELERLAFVTRCPANDFVARAGERLARANDDKSYVARFGRLVIPRAYLEFDRRRVGPVTLADESYHRASWMNALLPYCPESLERLVDRCGGCDTPLGWFYSLGVGHCDHCGEPVAASAEPSLPDVMADDYRLFALLSSPDAQGVEEGCARLPPALAVVSPGSLVRLALLLGGLIQPDHVATTDRNAVRTLPAPVLAAVAASGAALLRSWPTGLKKWVAAKTEELRGLPSALTALRARMKRIADRQVEPGDMVDVLVDALPDLHRHAAHGFSVDRAYYLYKPVQRMLGLNSPAMEALKKWPGIKFLKLNEAGKEQGQFDVEQIDELVTAFRKSTFINRCAQMFDLPIYAIEQLCAAGILEWEDHPALPTTGTGTKVRDASIEGLTSVLMRRARRETAPNDCVSIAVASRRIGGRLKPWASIVDWLRKGRIAYWASGDRPTTARFRIRAGDLARFQMVVDREAPPGFPISRLVSQEDAAEILNIAPKHMPALSADLALPFARHGQGLFASRDPVVAKAADLAWNAEIALQLNTHHRNVDDILHARGLDRVHTGWSRVRLVDRGILPPSP